MSDQAQRPTKAESLTISYADGRSHYNRAIHPAGNLACELLAARYGDQKQCILFPSGIAAIGFSINAAIRGGQHGLPHVVIGSELYSDTPRIVRHLQGHPPQFEFHRIDVTDPVGVESLFRDLKRQTVILFLETCTNPSGDVFDFSLVPQIRKRCRKLYFIADNTWITSSAFNPFDHAADLVVLSTSKHYSAGTCIGGAVIGDGKLIRKVSTEARVMGQHVSPLHAQRIIDAMPTLDQRASRAAELADLIAHDLQQHPAIIEVKYVGLPQHRSHELAKKYFRHGPSVLSFLVGLEKPDAEEWMANNGDVIPYETSFGGPHSKLDPWPKADRQERGTWCRLAIGYEDTHEELSRRLMCLLSKLPN